MEIKEVFATGMFGRPRCTAVRNSWPRFPIRTPPPFPSTLPALICPWFGPPPSVSPPRALLRLCDCLGSWRELTRSPLCLACADLSALVLPRGF